MSNQEFIKRLILLLLGILLVGIIFVWVVEDEDETTIIPSVPSYTEKSYTQEFRDSFISECVGETATYSYCDCAYNYLVKKHGDIGVAKLGIEYAETDEIPSELVEAAMFCQDKL